MVLFVRHFVFRSVVLKERQGLAHHHFAFHPLADYPLQNYRIVVRFAAAFLVFDRL